MIMLDEFIAEKGMARSCSASLSDREKLEAGILGKDEEESQQSVGNTAKESFDSDSTCTILHRDPPPSAADNHDSGLGSTSIKVHDDQILSTSRLFDEHHQSEHSLVSVSGNKMFDVDLVKDNEPDKLETRNEGDESRMDYIHAPYNQGYEATCRSSHMEQNPSVRQGFNEAELKMSFANQKVRQYFESIRDHSGDTRRLYQFYKSIRTELVACFLFTLITSKALIMCRTQLFEDDTLASSSYLQMAHYKDENQQQLAHSVGKSYISVHLVNGLVSAFTVASLTQVFGHISGCHLVPSISLALYVKGHISRARLSSYLAAQSVGSMLGTGLLGLLTTSQLTPAEFRELLYSSSQSRYSEISNPEELAKLSRPPDERPSRLNTTLIAKQPIRRKREVDDSVANSSETFRGNSETILLSIVRQHKLDKRWGTNQTGNVAYEPLKTIIANVSTSQVGQPGEMRTVASNATGPALLFVLLFGGFGGKKPSSSEEEAPFNIESSTTDIGATVLALPGKLQQVSQSSSTVSPLSDDGSRCAFKHASRILTTKTKIDDQSGPDRHLSELNLPHLDNGESGNLNFSESVSSKRTERIRRQIEQSLPNRGRENAENVKEVAGAKYYINLLEFALPDSIMSSESIRQCIAKQVTVARDKQHQQRQRQQNVDRYTKKSVDDDNTALLASFSFKHCLSLSNASQMFIFQLLATLIIVLTFLVNVDPRRTDLGFKSLSIGLGYFVAHMSTVQSGGFFGNPCHLLCLSWLSPTANWRPEWFIYLLTPFVGGLFGALSHEYIDFSSVRNRNRQLHLRRSFYSLDNMHHIEQAENQAQAGRLNSIGLDVVAKRGCPSSSGSLRSLAEVTSSVLTLNGNEPSTSLKSAAGSLQVSRENCNNIQHGTSA